MKIELDQKQRRDAEHLIGSCIDDSDRLEGAIYELIVLRARVAELETENGNLTFHSAVELQRSRAEKAEARVAELEQSWEECNAALQSVSDERDRYCEALERIADTGEIRSPQELRDIANSAINP